MKVALDIKNRTYLTLKFSFPSCISLIHNFLHDYRFFALQDAPEYMLQRFHLEKA